MFDFDKIMKLRQKYHLAEHDSNANRDPLFNAIQKKRYKHKYALLFDGCLEKNKEILIKIYHLDVMIKIASVGLENLTLVHLNTNMPSKILTGEFKGEVTSFDFNEFQDNISKFLNGDEINRNDMKVIEQKIHSFDFNKVVKLRQKYPLGCRFFDTEDSLFDAIQNGKYTDEYALLHERCLEKNKKIFFDTYYPDVIIKMITYGLPCFILVHLNSTKQAKILTGIFSRNATAIGSTEQSLVEQFKKSYLGADYLNHFIGEYKKRDFCDFQDTISKFINGDDIKRKDMNVIKHSEFDIKYINPYYYSSKKIYTINKLYSDKRKFFQNRGYISDDKFDFNEAIRFRIKYPHGAQYASGEKDSLFEAIQNNKYKYKYALLNTRWINKNRKLFFTTYYPDVIIKINSVGLEHLILVHLNTTKTSKILTGIFEDKVISDDIFKILEFMWLVDLGVNMLHCYIGKHEEKFRDFLNNISKFLNGEKVNRDDMNVIEYNEFNIYSVYPDFYTKQNIRVENEMKQKYQKFLRNHGDASGFNFNKTMWLRTKYQYGIPDFDEPIDSLFDAIQNNEYKYEYALLDKDWLEYNKKLFFDICHTDMIIKIDLKGLDVFILIHLNTNQPSKILTGTFNGNMFALDRNLNSEIAYPYDFIGEHKEDFCDFQNNISQFINGNDINRDDMNIIEYDEFDINHVDPFYYSENKIRIDNKLEQYRDCGDINAFDFNKIIALRMNYPDSKKLFDAIQNNEYTYRYVLLEDYWLEEHKEIFFNRYHPDIIININSLILNKFFIVHLNAIKPSKILTGVFNGYIFTLDRNLNSEIAYPYDFIGEHEEDFCDFQNNISKFINDDKINRNDMNIIKYNDFNINHIHPLYYSKQAIKIRKEIEQKDYKFLTDYVNVIDKPIEKVIRAKCLNKNNFRYPLKYDDIEEVELFFEVVKIQKGDIIGNTSAQEKCFYLYNSDYNDIYVDRKNYSILRCKDKKYTSYIVNYLNDKKIQIYLSIDIKDANEVKIINPTEDMLYIADKTQEFLMSPEKITFDEMNDVIRKSHQIKYDKESQKAINDSTIKIVYKTKLKELKVIIDGDLKEVNICFKNGAYKATIILCGSILEAFLLDWLAEYENVNDILEVAKYDDDKDWSLHKIIKELQKHMSQTWMEKLNADKIREERNMVHPKVYVKKQNEITKKECQKIINDLKYIIARRECYEH